MEESERKVRWIEIKAKAMRIKDCKEYCLGGGTI